MARIKFVLRSDFCEYVNHRGVAVSEREVKHWAREVGGTLKNGDVSKLLAGKPQTIGRVRLLVRFMLAHPSSTVVRDRRGALEGYLKVRALAVVLDSEIERIASVICISHESSILDAFLHGPSLFISGFRNAIRPGRLVRPAADGAEVDEAVRWMFIECGRLMGSDPSTPDEALASGQARIGVPVEEYASIVKNWVGVDPWVLCIIQDGDDRVGMGLCLPVAEAAFQQLRSGQLRPSDLTNKDLQSPSRNLMLEGVAMIPAEGISAATPPNSHLFFGFLAQLVHMGATRTADFRNPLRFLSFKATDSATKRLDAFGYSKTNTWLRGTKIEYQERIFPKRNPVDCGLWEAWKHYRRSMGSFRD